MDVQGLHNAVDQWRAAGGRLHRERRRRIPPPTEVLPRWHRGIEAAVRNPVARDAFRFGLYTGMRRSEVFGLRWTQVDFAAMTLRLEETKTGEPLELPLTRQLASCATSTLDRARAVRPGRAGQILAPVLAPHRPPHLVHRRLRHRDSFSAQVADETVKIRELRGAP